MFDGLAPFETGTFNAYQAPYPGETKTARKIFAIGVGGAGGNTITYLKTLNVKNVTLAIINTDKDHLDKCLADYKVLIGRELTDGTGAGGNPSIGKMAAERSLNKIDSLLEECKYGLVFIAAGMGGGTGTGAAPVVARVAKQKGAIVVAVVTFPFKLEGPRIQVAKYGIRELRKYADTVIVIDNEKLSEVAGAETIEAAFGVASELLGKMIKAVSEAAFQKGLVNVDFADIKTVLKWGKVALIGHGVGKGENRIEEAVENALRNPLLDVDITEANAALIYIIAGRKVTLNEVKGAAETIANQILPGAYLRWGVQLDESKGDEVEVILILTGVKSESILTPLTEVESVEDESSSNVFFQQGAPLPRQSEQMLPPFFGNPTVYSRTSQKKSFEEMVKDLPKL